jgi:hypothetical protein
MIGTKNAEKLYLSRFNLLLPVIQRNYLKIDDTYSFRNTEVANQLALGVCYAYMSLVKGDIAEFGTAYGVTARVIAEAMAAAERDLDHCIPKNLYLFDSFEGLPEAQSEIDKEKPRVKNGTWTKGTCKGLTRKQLVAVCGRSIDKDKIIVQEGWFSETVKSLADNTRFSMIHFDGDLYQSTMDVFEPCFERGFISEGAMIFFDDWNSNYANPAWGERRAWRELVERYSVEFSDEGSYASTSHAFIVHSYEK